jgi:hypothetical protein
MALSDVLLLDVLKCTFVALESDVERTAAAHADSKRF